MKEIQIGLVGAGTVGGGVIKLLAENIAHFAKDCGIRVRLAAVADMRTERFSSPDLAGALASMNTAVHNNANAIINDPSIDIVIELVGGTTFAKDLILSALEHKKQVITANKALIAEHGPVLFEAAKRNNVSIYFEASVGGGMPVIKTVREALIANRIHNVQTIINGTCNYILTRMTQDGLEFADVLAQAQKAGYAEADPTLDIGGGDSGHKVAILASLIHDGYVPYEKMPVEGITSITRDDIAFAGELGYVIKLLGIIRTHENSPVEVRVHPAMLPKDHVLATVNNVFNAVLIDGSAVGRILVYGRGAGEAPTASAVMSDVADACRDLASGSTIRLPMDCYAAKKEIPIKPPAEVVSRFYLCFWVSDQPKVLAAISAELGNRNISIASVLQKEPLDGTCVPVIITTHPARECDVANALDVIEKCDFVKKPTHRIRIVD